MGVVCANAIAYGCPSDRIQVVRSYPVHSTLNENVDYAYPLGLNLGSTRGMFYGASDRSTGECATGDAARGNAGLLGRLEYGRDRGQPTIGG